MSALPEPVSTRTVRESTWDEVCSTWHLLDRADLSVEQQRIPAGTAARTHSHPRSRQFVRVLSGTATVRIGPRTVQVEADEGLEIPPGVRHQIRNDSGDALHLLVISSPRPAENRYAHRPRPSARGRGRVVIGSYLRPTRVGDLPAIVAIEEGSETRRFIGQGGAAWHEHVIEDPAMEHWVLVDRLDRVVAYGILADIGEAGFVELRRMAVVPAGRGQGLGRVLLRHLLEHARARPSVRAVWLDVGDDNTRALSLYRSYGFAERPAPAWAVLLDNGVYLEWNASA
ncbi:GNAT family N-acetyltransferase [Ornithinimicrobium sp. Y1694]|uniref:GNAT family N-acetyltransferase n=1 Tax=Ornithinimicrobium sp. Y1694 TaxID=3418590 RepID=UPI003CEB8BDE